MNQLRIAHKLWLSVLAIVVMLAAVVAFAGYRSAKVQAESDVATANMTVRVESALRWAGLTETNAARTYAMVVSSELAGDAAFKSAMVSTSAQISETQKQLEGMDLGEADRAQMASIAAARKNMIDARAQALKLMSDGQQDEAIAFVGKTYNPASAAYLQTLRDFVHLQQQTARDLQQRNAAGRAVTVQLAGMAVGVVLLIIAGGAWLLIRSIQQPLAEANALAARIAAGDLSASDNVTRGDEFGQLLHSLYAMSDSLGRMVHLVRQSTDSIAVASAQIATGNHDLSARTEQTSSSLQETAAAMEQFTSTIAQSAGSAQQASGLAIGASGVARRGGEVVSEVVATMQEINHSSQKISDIIGVIDSIAFQTNILALNAAVEAARAGEQGRGFAVVASEVRSLAGRSAEAAKEIKGLIGASVEKVAMGTRLVSDAGTTMGDIVQSVQRVTDMMGEITAASTEQSAGISQVNQAVGSLDQMTQQNAALVEESAAAAQSLREQAEQLAQVVAAFKLPLSLGVQSQGAAHHSAVPAPARSAPAPVAHAPSRTAAVRRATPAPRLATAPASTRAPVAPRAAAPAAAMASADTDWESF